MNDDKPHVYLMDEFLTDEERKKRRETSLAMLDLMLNSDVDLNHLPKDAIKFWTDEDK